ncbi:hypothetical protein YC2023_041576 [Brassica napus]
MRRIHRRYEPTPFMEFHEVRLEESSRRIFRSYFVRAVYITYKKVRPHLMNIILSIPKNIRNLFFNFKFDFETRSLQEYLDTKSETKEDEELRLSQN